jgi:hypothetical protein
MRTHTHTCIRLRSRPPPPARSTSTLPRSSETRQPISPPERWILLRHQSPPTHRKFAVWIITEPGPSRLLLDSVQYFLKLCLIILALFPQLDKIEALALLHSVSRWSLTFLCSTGEKAGFMLKKYKLNLRPWSYYYIFDLARHVVI